MSVVKISLICNSVSSVLLLYKKIVFKHTGKNFVTPYFAGLKLLVSKHLDIFGSFHRIITSSYVSLSHSFASIALCLVMCLSNDSSCQCVILTIWPSQARNSASGIPYSGSNISLDSHHLTLGHFIGLLSTLHS